MPVAAVMAWWRADRDGADDGAADLAAAAAAAHLAA
jgi:hypothetical protein